MTTSPTLPQNFIIDTWVKATWEEFMALAYNPAYETGKAYYNRGKVRSNLVKVGGTYTIFYKNLLKSKPPSEDSFLNLSAVRINKSRSE